MRSKLHFLSLTTIGPSPVNVFNTKEVLVGFLICDFQNFCSHANLLGFWPQNGQIWSKICIFGHFGPNIAIFCTFCPMPNQKPMWTRCLGGFSVMWVTKLLIFPVEIRIFCPKTTKFGPKLAFLVNLGQAMQAYSMPCCGSVGGCGARAVSRKTPIYFIQIDLWYVWIMMRNIAKRNLQCLDYSEILQVNSCGVLF